MSKFDMLLNWQWKEIQVHNVGLVDASPGEDGQVSLSVRLANETAVLLGAGTYADWYRDDIGKFGYLERAVTARDLRDRFYFRAYADQSLRRVYELDLPATSPDGRVPDTVGWRCASRPEGFRAPATVIPGQGGDFVADETIAVTLRVPPEFVMECRQVQRTPEEVLRGFIADAASIQNYVARPRADGYSSNGSDERSHAESWLDRAYGMERVSIEAIAVEDQERADIDDATGELQDCLNVFRDQGGSIEEFLDAVQALVPRKAAETKGDAGGAGGA
jgi:hypothetical protein